jgi:hypothetical protein
MFELDVLNPLPQVGGGRQGGHRMAQDSVRQRLAANFPGRVRLEVSSGPDHYRVHLCIPYVRHEAAHR